MKERKIRGIQKVRNRTMPYAAGFIQGKVLYELIAAARDDLWNYMYYCGQVHTSPKWLHPLVTYTVPSESLSIYDR
jgi:hypothetical protein